MITRFLFLLCYLPMLQATLTRIDSFVLSDNRELSIIADNHSLENAEYEYRYQELLKQGLEAIDNQGIYTVTFLVEKPAQLTKFFTCTPRLTFDLDTLVQELNLKKSKVKDCEIRCYSGAAQLILQASNPATIFPMLNYNAQEVFCCLKEVTFEQVMQEWEQYYTFLSSQCRLSVPFAQKLQEAYDAYQSLKISLQAYAPETVLCYAQHSANRKVLGHAIYQALAPLFELSLFHTLQNTTSQKIIIITGFLHAEELGRMARTFGAHFQKMWGSSTNEPLDQDIFQDWITHMQS